LPDLTATSVSNIFCLIGKGRGGNGDAYPDTASLSAVEFRFTSMNVCATNAPICGLTPFVVISAALMLLLFEFPRSMVIMTSEGRLNCESIVLLLDGLYGGEGATYKECRFGGLT
jgi:hypothetical protein